jgi:hypothetical protein
VTAEEDFIVDIPYPKHLIPLPTLNAPIYKPISADVSRPRSRLSSSHGSTLGSTVESTADNSENGSPRHYMKRDLTTHRPEKRGLVGFLTKNSLSIIGGAVAVGGGLWLWERYLRMRAERIAKQKGQTVEVKKAAKVEKPTSAGTREKRAIDIDEEGKGEGDDNELEYESDHKCACVGCECPGCWCTNGNCGKETGKDGNESNECGCSNGAEVNLLDS